MTIEERIKEFVSKNLIFSNNGYPFRDEESFLDRGIVDSLGIMQLVLFVEDQFMFHVEDSDITPMNFDSVSRLARFIRYKTKTDA